MGGLRLMSLSWINMSPNTLSSQLRYVEQTYDSLLASMYQSSESCS
jgi:hypothetical protein